MAKNVFQPKYLISLALIVMLLILFVSACNLIGGSRVTDMPEETRIVSPPENASVLRSNKDSVQIFSTFKETDISRVELWVKGASDPAEKLLRSDIPTNGAVVQPYIPNQIGPAFIKIKAYKADGSLLAELFRTIQVMAETAVTLATPAPIATAVAPTPITTSTLGDAASVFQVAGGTEVAVIQIVATPVPAATPTPTPFYPPPPPIPGVPPGPTQSPALNVHPPVCDAAEYLGPYSPGTDQQIFVPSPDDLPAKVAAGSVIHRAWRLRNVGTCTWGPGYELAFYGGRSMGSGGVAFETIFPPGDVGRNKVVDPNRLVVPEGKPNQTAVVEVLLQAPTIPGVHQSYWRMRNPQGIYFGPIIGVTLQVVRECQPAPGQTGIIYGAPTINYCRLVSLGGVFEPVPIPVAPVTPIPATPVPPTFLAQQGNVFQVAWSIVNAQDYSIVIKDPLGRPTELKTGSATDQSPPITLTELGEYNITCSAVNNACEVSQQLRIKVYPNPENQLQMRLVFPQQAQAYLYSTDARVSFSPDVLSGTVRVQWNYYGQEAQFTMAVTPTATTISEQCLLGDWLCYQSSGTVTGQAQVAQFTGSGPSGTVTLQDTITSYCQTNQSPNYFIEVLLAARPIGTSYSNQIITDNPPIPIYCAARSLPTEVPSP
jgi:hypothetical protein